MIGLRALPAICITIDHLYMGHLFDVSLPSGTRLLVQLCQLLPGVSGKDTAGFCIVFHPVVSLCVDDPDVDIIQPEFLHNLRQMLLVQMLTHLLHDIFQFPRLNEAIGILKKQKLHRPDQQHDCTKTQQCRRKDFLSLLLPAVAFPFCLISLQNDSQLL